MDFWIDLVAVWNLGAVGIPIEFDATSERLVEVLRLSSPSWHVGALQTANRAEDMPKSADSEVDADLAEDVCEQIEPDYQPVDDVALILFTSGSTGKPKGVVLSHASILGNAVATASLIRLRSDDILGVVIPYRFVSALSHFLVCALSGACYVGSERKMDRDELVSFLLDHNCTTYGGSPLQARWIAEWLESRPAECPHYEALRLSTLISSGDFFPEEVGSKLRRHLPATRILVMYGLTEVAGRICIRDFTAKHSLTNSSNGEVGAPIPGLEVRVMDEATKMVQDGESGCIYVRGAYLFDGYLIDDLSVERLGQVFDGWFPTGDIGYKDEDGLVHLQGRSDDIFKSAGHKVSCCLISATLMALDIFEDVAVVSRRHPRLGHVPCVYYVEKREGIFDLKATMPLLRTQLPSSHLPWRFIKVITVPRTGSGKIDRRQLLQLEQE